MTRDSERSELSPSTRGEGVIHDSYCWCDMITFLLKQKRFFPLFCTQLFGAFNDNLFKNALVILVTYTLINDAKQAQAVVALAGGIFILPFFLFSATAGQLADKFEKSILIRWVKLAEIIIMSIAGLGFMLGNTFLLMATLFCLGAQSAFFGPLKYAILPDHLRDSELITGNALIEASTFVSILIGTIVGGVLITLDNGIYWVTSLGLIVAVLGLISSLSIPLAKSDQPDLRISANIIATTWRIIHFAREDRRVFLSILGISWFWLVGATFLAQFPGLSKDLIGAHAHIVTLFLSLFSVGIATGSLISERVQRGQINATFVPLGILGLSVFVADLYFASRGIITSQHELSLREFIAMPTHWRMMADIFFISLCGGLYVVPLYAMVQYYARAEVRSRIIAANNIINAFFMTISAGILALLLAQDVTIPQVFLVISLLNGLVGFYICRLLPAALIKSLIRGIFRFCYHVEVQGLEHYPKESGRSIVVANHVSFLDGLLLDAYLPERYLFAIDKRMASLWWMKPMLALVNAFELEPTNPMSIKSLIREVEKKQSCIIFPEGRLTKTGALMKVYEGPGLIADKTRAHLVPVRIDGAQYTPFTRLRGKVRTRWFPKITLTILPFKHLEIPDNLSGRARRQFIGGQLYDVMTDLMFASSNLEQPLFYALLDARHCHGRQTTIIEDIQRQCFTYQQLITRCCVLARLLKAHMLPGEFVGFMLPNSVSAVVTFFAMQRNNVVPAMLNYSTGHQQMLLACQTACIRTVLTSRKFIELAELKEAILALEQANIRCIYLEDLAASLSWWDQYRGWLDAQAPAVVWRRRSCQVQAEHPAVILFTSGSEGSPKGVMLSHRNIQANRYQLTSKIDFNAQDIAFTALPMFHSFGLTAGTLLPLFSGIKTFLYPSPLHYRVIPELIYDINATILFGTDSFLSGYARSAHPYDFYSLRYVFAGAEKLTPETRQLYAEKFGVRIFEGYGATETAPALAMNTPMHNRVGSVGRLLPNIEAKLEPVDGVEEGGRLWVRGDNIMIGYLKIDKPGQCQPPIDGWYDTGDIVSIDDQGYVNILGRAKRFAKIAGEMISLTAIEGHINRIWPDKLHAVMAIPDDKKGEQLVLVTEQADANRDAILNAFRAQGIAEIQCPKQVIAVAKLPLLATGKADYPAISQLISAVN